MNSVPDPKLVAASNPLSPEANKAAAFAAATATATGVLTVDLDAIVANWRKLEKTAVPAECAAVVKADAYGCGVEPVARALAGAGCKTLFVATLDEARGARFIEGGYEKRLAAGTGQRSRDRLDPAAIGVRLDHRGAFGRHGGFLELAPVRNDGIEVDGEPAGSGGGGSGESRRFIRLRGQRVAGGDQFGIGNGVHAALYAPGSSGSTASV